MNNPEHQIRCKVSQPQSMRSPGMFGRSQMPLETIRVLITLVNKGSRTLWISGR